MLVALILAACTECGRPTFPVKFVPAVNWVWVCDFVLNLTKNETQFKR